jgi:hypothetical protein
MKPNTQMLGAFKKNKNQQFNYFFLIRTARNELVKMDLLCHSLLCWQCLNELSESRVKKISQAALISCQKE